MIRRLLCWFGWHEWSYLESWNDTFDLYWCKHHHDRLRLFPKSKRKVGK